MQKTSLLLWCLAAVAAIASCERPDRDEIARLTEARPRLAAAARVAEEIAAGQRRCESPFPGYPSCESDHGQVLVIAPYPAGKESGAGTRLDGLLYVRAGRPPALTMTLWHFDSLGAPLGHGWHQVVAISHID